MQFKNNKYRESQIYSAYIELELEGAVDERDELKAYAETQAENLIKKLREEK